MADHPGFPRKTVTRYAEEPTQDSPTFDEIIQQMETLKAKYAGAMSVKVTYVGLDEGYSEVGLEVTELESDDAYAKRLEKVQIKRAEAGLTMKAMRDALKKTETALSKMEN